MKNNIVKIFGGMILAILVISTFTFLAFAQNDSKSQNGGGRLEGTWDVQVTVRNCQTGAAIRPAFPTLVTYMSGGTLIASESAVPQSSHTPGHGVWSHTSGNNYSSKFKAFNFNANGNFSGWTIISNEIALDSTADESASTGAVEIYASNGVLIFTGCSTTTATRFE